MFVAFATQPLLSGLLVMAPFGEFPPPGLEALVKCSMKLPIQPTQGVGTRPMGL